MLRFPVVAPQSEGFSEPWRMLLGIAVDQPSWRGAAP